MTSYTVGLYTLGCKVSQYETEAIAESFERAGFTVKDFSELNDVYVINTCTVTAEADRKSRQIIRRAKKRNPRARVLVCGCYSQRSPEEVAGIEGVDAVIGSGGKMQLVSIAERLLSGEGKIISVTDIDKEPFEKMSVTKGQRTRVYVKIEDGCECRCSYCAIPSARGVVRSKPKDEVISEVMALSAIGVHEVVLTGIETGSYGADFPEKYTLADLLFELDAKGAAARIRLGSLAPELVGKDFVDKVAGISSLAPHFHISLQSGSDLVLRAMRRRYSRKMALENIKRLREAIPRATFTTDVMVGFPGETETDFLDTVSFVEEIGFLDCHVFAYSKRKNTPAEKLPCQIPEEVKRDRSERLIKVAGRVRLSVIDKAISDGEPMPVVFETKTDSGYIGHTDNFIEVMVECCGEDLRGKCRLVLPVTRKDDIVIGKMI